MVGYTSYNNNKLVLVGDFNIHVDIKDDPSARNFMDIVDWVQHVKRPTHVSAFQADLHELCNNLIQLSGENLALAYDKQVNCWICVHHW